MTLPGLCRDCHEPVDEALRHPACCAHEGEIGDIEARPFGVLVGWCADCGALVTAEQRGDGGIIWSQPA